MRPHRGDNGCLRLVGQMVLVALVIGTSVAAAATERVTLSLVLTSTLAWSFVPVVQLLTGLGLTAGAATGRRLYALERYFETHPAWSLWILAVHAVFLLWPAARGLTLLLVPTGILPAVLTVRALRRVCSEALGMPAAAARRAVAVHQAITWMIVGAYVGWASAYVPRLVGWLS